MAQLHFSQKPNTVPQRRKQSTICNDLCCLIFTCATPILIMTHLKSLCGMTLTYVRTKCFLSRSDQKTVLFGPDQASFDYFSKFSCLEWRWRAAQPGSTPGNCGPWIDVSAPRFSGMVQKCIRVISHLASLHRDDGIHANPKGHFEVRNTSTTSSRHST